MTRKSVPVLRKELEASHFLRESGHRHEFPIAILEINPLGQTHVSLGEYTLDRPPIGFSITITPDHESKMTL
jgi:hypothetical protein